jgi:hypothetical protein
VVPDHETFRFRLVHLLDGALDLPSATPLRHFTLDGRRSCSDISRCVRAPRAIMKLVRDGRLLVGPWFVPPDSAGVGRP